RRRDASRAGTRPGPGRRAARRQLQRLRSHRPERPHAHDLSPALGGDGPAQFRDARPIGLRRALPAHRGSRPRLPRRGPKRLILPLRLSRLSPLFIFPATPRLPMKTPNRGLAALFVTACVATFAHADATLTHHYEFNGNLLD